MKTTHQQQAYALARIILGINFLIHGLVRIPKLQAFSNGMVTQFQGSPMPAGFTKAFASVLPFAEAIIGLFILLGLLTRQALLAAGILIGILVFGTCLIEKWDIAGEQMNYALYIAALLFLGQYNAYSITRTRASSV